MYIDGLRRDAGQIVKVRRDAEIGSQYGGAPEEIYNVRRDSGCVSELK